MSIGDAVRKETKRGAQPTATMGVVTELVMQEGKQWARVAAGTARTVTSLWPIKQLELAG